MLAMCLMAVTPSFYALSFSLPSQNAELMLDIITEQRSLQWQGTRAGFAMPCHPPAAFVVLKNLPVPKPGV